MTAPTAPTNILATAGYGMARATWNPPNGVVTQGSSASISGSVFTPNPPTAWTVNTYTGYILTDSTGATFPVVSNTATALTVTGTPTGTGAWTISAFAAPTSYTATLEALVTSGAGGTGSLNAFAPSPTPSWTVNAYQGMVLYDSALTAFTIASNSATTLTVTGTPASGAWVIDAYPRQTVTNATQAGGQLPQAEVVFGQLPLGVSVTISVVAANGSGSSTPVVSSSVTPAVLPGQISNVITSIMGNLAWCYANLIQAPCPRMRFGKKYLADLKDAPMVVFVPGRADIEGPTHLGNSTPGLPNQYWTRKQHIVAHCWGVQLPTADPTQDYIVNYGVAEQIANYVAAVVHEVATGFELSYSTDFSGVQDNESRGALIKLEFAVFVPITEIVPPAGDVATITDFDPYTVSI